jgi:hypothetical protein
MFATKQDALKCYEYELVTWVDRFIEPYNEPLEC